MQQPSVIFLLSPMLELDRVSIVIKNQYRKTFDYYTVNRLPII